MAVKAPAMRSAGGAPPTIANRIRCVHCGMPVRQSLPACWSCGLIPDDAASTRADAEAAGLMAAEPGPTNKQRFGRLASIVAAGLVLGAAIAVVVALAIPDDHGTALRRVADRVKGDDWTKLTQPAFSIDFPAAPRRLPGRPGADGVPSDIFEATSTGTTYRVETASLPVDAAATDGDQTAKAILDGQLTTLGIKDATVVTVIVDGARGADVTTSTHHLRSVVFGHRAFLFDVSGANPEPGFTRFTGSFQLLDR